MLNVHCGYTRKYVRFGKSLYCSFMLMRTYIVKPTDESIIWTVTAQLILTPPAPCVTKRVCLVMFRSITLHIWPYECGETSPALNGWEKWFEKQPNKTSRRARACEGGKWVQLGGIQGCSFGRYRTSVHQTGAQFTGLTIPTARDPQYRKMSKGHLQKRWGQINSGAYEKSQGALKVQYVRFQWCHSWAKGSGESNWRQCNRRRFDKHPGKLQRNPKRHSVFS